MTSKYSRYVGLPVDGGFPETEVVEELVGHPRDEWEDVGITSPLDMAEKAIENAGGELELDFSDGDGKVWSFVKALNRVVELRAEDEDEDVPELSIVDAPATAVSSIEKEDVPSMRKLQGRVSHASPVYEVAELLEFQCEGCGSKVKKNQQMHSLDITYPDEECDCGGSYKPDAQSSKRVDYQRIVIEDLPENGDESIEVYCHGDLIRSGLPGQRVDVIAAIVPYHPDKSENMFERRVVALEIENQDDVAEVEMTDNELEMVERVSGREDTIEQLVDSFAPELVELEEEKRGLLHAMVSRNEPDVHEGENGRRGIIHCALVGPPASGKSELLKAADRISIRSEFGSGAGASGIGLTAATVKDEIAGEYVLKPGLLPRANNGIAITDELDKLTKTDKQKLADALQHQEVNVAKADITACLPAKAPFLAASNPADGTFNDHEPLLEQISYPPEILSRFDLLYRVTKPSDNELLADALTGNDSEKTTTPPLTEAEMRIYLHWARQIETTIPDSVGAYAARSVQEYLDYIDTHSEGAWFDTRKGRAVNRLARSHARLNGREIVENEDIDAAVELLQESIGEFVNSSAFDIESLYSGRSSERNEIRQTIRHVIDDEEDVERVIEDVAEELDTSEDLVQSVIDAMAEEDELWIDSEQQVRLTS